MYRTISCTDLMPRETDRNLLEIFDVIGLCDLVDLWVIRIRKPMILCARSTSSSSEQSVHETWITQREYTKGLFIL